MTMMSWKSSQRRHVLICASLEDPHNELESPLVHPLCYSSTIILSKPLHSSSGTRYAIGSMETMALYSITLSYSPFRVDRGLDEQISTKERS